MRVIEFARKLLGLLRRAVCPRQVRRMMDDVESRRSYADPGIDPTWADRLSCHRMHSMLSRLYGAIRMADPDAALTALARCGGGLLDDDPAYFNLLGVIAEMRREWRAANWLYGQALFVDKTYRPAQCNLRRLYELYTFGRTRESVAIGDETEDVLFARLPGEEMDPCR